MNLLNISFLDKKKISLKSHFFEPATAIYPGDFTALIAKITNFVSDEISSDTAAWQYKLTGC